MLIRSLKLMFHVNEADAGTGGGAPSPADVAAQAAATKAAADKAVADAGQGKTDEDAEAERLLAETIAAEDAKNKKTIEDLEPWAQKEIRDARAEAAKARVEKNKAQADKEKVLAALGLGPDGKDLPTDPTVAASQSETLAAKRELAVFKAANGKADPAKLLDSRSFINSIAAVDPSDSSAIVALIEAAVKENPQFKTTTQAAGSSGLGTLTGGGEPGKITEEEMVRLSKEDPEKLDKLYREGKLAHLL